MATTARLLSVTLTASTTPLSASPRRRTTFAAALLGGFSSAVITNSPDLRRLANALNEKDLSISERSSSSVEPLIFPFFGSDLAPQRVSAGCRGVIGPFPQPLWMKGVAYEVSKDASTYTSPAFACPIGSLNAHCAPSATNSPPTRRYRAAGARRPTPVRRGSRS